MENENKITGKQMWKLFKIQNKFFKELYLMLEELDEIDFEGFDYYLKGIKQEKDVLNVSGKFDKDSSEIWVADRLQFSYKKNKERIGINLIFRDTEGVNLFDEPMIVYSFYKLKEEGASDEWDNIFIISALNRKNKFIVNSIISLSGLIFENGNSKKLTISKGYLKAGRLFDIKNKKDIQSLAEDIKSWIKDSS